MVELPLHFSAYPLDHFQGAHVPYFVQLPGPIPLMSVRWLFVWYVAVRWCCRFVCVSWALVRAMSSHGIIATCTVRQVMNLRICCIWLVDSVESIWINLFVLLIISLSPICDFCNLRLSLNPHKIFWVLFWLWRLVVWSSGLYHRID
jgi:hypothetical protein